MWMQSFGSHRGPVMADDWWGGGSLSCFEPWTWTKTATWEVWSAAWVCMERKISLVQTLALFFYDKQPGLSPKLAGETCFSALWGRPGVNLMLTVEWHDTRGQLSEYKNLNLNFNLRCFKTPAQKGPVAPLDGNTRCYMALEKFFISQGSLREVTDFPQTVERMLSFKEEKTRKLPTLLFSHRPLKTQQLHTRDIVSVRSVLDQLFSSTVEEPGKRDPWRLYSQMDYFTQNTNKETCFLT